MHLMKFTQLRLPFKSTERSAQVEATTFGSLISSYHLYHIPFASTAWRTSATKQWDKCMQTESRQVMSTVRRAAIIH